MTSGSVHVNLTGGEAVSQWLVDNDDVGEWLLEDVRWMTYGYAFQLQFLQVIDGDGKVVEHPIQAKIHLDAVYFFQLESGLTPPMVEGPEYINWGLSEVASVRLDLTEAARLNLRIRWEDARRIDIEFQRVTLHATRIPFRNY